MSHLFISYESGEEKKRAHKDKPVIYFLCCKCINDGKGDIHGNGCSDGRLSENAKVHLDVSNTIYFTVSIVTT